MSQERTESRDFAKDREIIGAATPGPWRRQNCLVAGRGAFAGQVIADCGHFKPIDEANAIYITESRVGWPAALDEIDRLNATIADMQGDLESMGRVVDDKDHEIRDLTAKVQERDRQIEQFNKQEKIDESLLNTERSITMSMLEKQDKEIERLRAEIQKAQEKAFKIIRVAEFNADGEIEELANILRDQLRAALKGAE